MSGSRYDSAAGYSGRAADRWQAWEGSEDVARLGQMISVHLFAAGLNLQSTLALIGESPAADRCAQALTELDDMLRKVRHAVLGARNLHGDGQSSGGRCVPPDLDGWARVQPPA